MSYISEFFKFRKTGKKAGQYIFYRRMSVDHISELRVGSIFKILTKTNTCHKYYIDRVEHIYYDEDKEYYVQYFIREIEVV